MTFKVSVAHGAMRLSAVFPTEAMALSEARNQIEHRASDIRIEIMATREEFTFDEFRVKMAGVGRKTSHHST